MTNALPIVLTAAEIARFWPKVDTSRGLFECWPWIAAIDAHGYGEFRLSNARVVKAHRVAYTLLVGPIPDELDLDHECRNTPCVNPAHLEPVTVAENNRRIAERSFACRRGHLWEGNDPIVRAGARAGRRECRICRNEGKRARWARAQAMEEVA